MTDNNQTKPVSGRYKNKAPSRGGTRKNSGRKSGAATKKTREIADKAAQEGITPLEVMLKAMREFVVKAEAMGQDEIKVVDNKAITRLSLMNAAAGVAKDAAPYIHPRLAAIEHTGKDGQPLANAAPIINLTVNGQKQA